MRDKPELPIVPSEVRPLIDLSGLAKILPVEKIYDDLFARGFREAGAMFENWVKRWRLALPAVQLDAVEQDRFRRAIEDPYFRVPPDRRVLPAAQIVGQVVEGLRYEPEGTTIWQMWEELLARASDSERLGEAHPAYPHIIKQLSPDEAKLLLALATVHPRSYPTNEPIPTLGTVDMGLAYPENLSFYLGHLLSLGLLVAPFGFDPVHHHVVIDKTVTYMLNDVGRRFITAVSARTDSTG